MRSWLAAAVAAPLLASSAAQAQTKGAQPRIEETSHGAVSFRLPATTEFTSQSPLQDGMIAQQQIGPNAHFGLGLAPMLGRNIHSVTNDFELVPTRNPGVTFVVKFRR